MSLSSSTLASDIATALGHSGNVTLQVLGFAQGIIDELTQNGVASTGPITGNTISGVTGSSMASKISVAAGFGSVSAKLLNFCNGISSHITSAANITYTGPGTSPPYSTGGTISGLSGSAMASLISSNVGYGSVTSILLAMATAVTNHITINAQANAGVIT